MTGDDLVEVQKAIDGLSYPSESDAPFDLVRWGRTSVSAKDQVAAHAGGKRPVEELSLDDFFAPLEATDDAERFRMLHTALKQCLTDVKVFRAGTIHVEIFVIGRTGAGEWAGVHTKSVET